MKKKSFLIALISIFIIFSFTFNSFALNLENNDRGEKVKEVQQMLNNLGYDITADGVFGARTESTIKSFQSNNGLDVDGVIGNKTYETLKEVTSEIEYEVKKGDTLYDLAKEYDISIEDIKKRNNLSSYIIRPGDKIYIPKTGKGGGKTDNLKNNIIHEVEAGDSLSLIAKRYGTDIETIKLANNLKNSNIRIGEELTIPHMDNHNEGSFKLAKGAFIWPVMGRISSGYGYRIHPIKKERAFHSGIDLAVPLGKEIRAAASG
ncbi:MAG: LysM peptidoglycan-binding domain-containing protein, partial [Bacillota bacterium]